MTVAFSIYIGPLWEKIYCAFLSESTAFEVIFPEVEYDLDNPLMGGKKEIDRMEEIVISPWSGMTSSILLRGEFKKQDKDLFIQLMSPSFEGDKPVLWHFNLYKHDRLLLSIEDFSICLMDNSPELQTILERIGIVFEDIISMSEK